MSRKKARRPTPIPRQPRAYPKLPPKAAAEMHYAGDRRGALWQVMGPNSFRERMTVVEATYDPATDRTTLGLAYGVHIRPLDQGSDLEPGLSLIDLAGCDIPTKNLSDNVTPPLKQGDIGGGDSTTDVVPGP